MDAEHWKPIETAPLNGQMILLAGPQGYVAAAKFHRARWSGDREGWWEANTDPTDAIDVEFLHPTHWMPLPESPCEMDTGASRAAEV